MRKDWGWVGRLKGHERGRNLGCFRAEEVRGNEPQDIFWLGIS